MVIINFNPPSNVELILQFLLTLLKILTETRNSLKHSVLYHLSFVLGRFNLFIWSNWFSFPILWISQMSLTTFGDLLYFSQSFDSFDIRNFNCLSGGIFLIACLGIIDCLPLCVIIFTNVSLVVKFMIRTKISVIYYREKMYFGSLFCLRHCFVHKIDQSLSTPHWPMANKSFLRILTLCVADFVTRVLRGIPGQFAFPRHYN